MIKMCLLKKWIYGNSCFFFFQSAMQQLTQLLSEDLGKEIYGLWEVSLHSFNHLVKFRVTYCPLPVYR